MQPAGNAIVETSTPAGNTTVQTSPQYKTQSTDPNNPTRLGNSATDGVSGGRGQDQCHVCKAGQYYTNVDADQPNTVFQFTAIPGSEWKQISAPGSQPAPNTRPGSPAQGQGGTNPWPGAVASPPQNQANQNQANQGQGNQGGVLGMGQGNQGQGNQGQGNQGGTKRGDGSGATPVSTTSAASPKPLNYCYGENCVQVGDDVTGWEYNRSAEQRLHDLGLGPAPATAKPAPVEKTLEEQWNENDQNRIKEGKKAVKDGAVTEQQNQMNLNSGSMNRVSDRTVRRPIRILDPLTLPVRINPCLA